MGILRRKSNKQQTPVNKTDKSIHRTFQFGGLFLLGFIVYSIYFDDSSNKKPIAEGDISQAELNVRVKAAFDQMTSSPEFQHIKDFVLYIETNVDKEEAKILNAKDGVLVYIPEKMLGTGTNSLKIENENVKISVSGEKKPQIPSKAAAEGQSQEIKTDEKPVEAPAAKQ